MSWYHGRTVLITGASGGIGEAMARQLAAPGVTLLLSARSEAALDRLAEALRQQGAEAHVFPQDLAQPEGARALYRSVEEAGLTVDVLVNNAGFGTQGLFQENDLETYEEMLTLNVTALVSLTRLCLPGMLARGSGGVLNVASTAAFTPVPRFAVYAASKSFVKEFSQALHEELRGSGVHVTCLAPGPTATGFFDRAALSGVPGGRAAATPEDVARDGIEALARNRRVKVSGLVNRLSALAAGLAPTALTLKAARRMMEGMR